MLPARVARSTFENAAYADFVFAAMPSTGKLTTLATREQIGGINRYRHRSNRHAVRSLLTGRLLLVAMPMRPVLGFIDTGRRRATLSSA